MYFLSSFNKYTFYRYGPGANLLPGRFGVDRSLSCGMNDREKLSLTSLETITDALLEMMEACMRDIPDCNWLQSWISLSKSFAFQYNPALQPRALIVFGCISKCLIFNN